MDPVESHKPSKEEREKEFIDAVEQILGFPLMEHQKILLLKVRQDSLRGRSIDFSLLRKKPQ